MEKVTKNSQARLMFRTFAESTDVFLEYIAGIVEATHFPHAASLIKSFQSNRESLSNLIALQLITHVDVCFAQEVFRLGLCYSHEVNDQDDTDLSFLQEVPIEIDQLTLRFYTIDVENAQLVGFHQIESTTHVPGLLLELIPVEVKAYNGGDQESSEPNILAEQPADYVLDDPEVMKSSKDIPPEFIEESNSYPEESDADDEQEFI